MASNLVLGLGNPIRQDDGIGIFLCEKLEKDEQISRLTEWEFIASGEAGMALLDLICGYQNLVVIDSMVSGKHPPGTISKLQLPQILTGATYKTSPHHTTFGHIFTMGQQAQLPLPQKVTIFAVEIKEFQDFGFEFSPEIEKSISPILEEIKGKILRP